MSGSYIFLKLNCELFSPDCFLLDTVKYIIMCHVKELPLFVRLL